MKVIELFESLNSYAYHVTFTNYVDVILKQGIKPLQTSNWKKQGADTRYNEEGGVFAFADPEDAFKWAFKMGFEFKKPVSIIKIKRSSSWHKDPSADIMLSMGNGDALRSIGAIPPSEVLNVYAFDDFGKPGNGVSSEEWIQNAVNTIS